MTKRKTHETFAREVYNLVSDEYLIIGQYENSKTKILFKHLTCGYKWETMPSVFLKGSRCPKCAGNIKKTTVGYEKALELMWGKEYSLLSEYTGDRYQVKLRHNVCRKEYYVIAGSVVSGRRCPHCYRKIRKTTTAFKKEVKTLVGKEYSVLGQYVTALSKIKMKHSLCGREFSIRPNEFLQGKRCSKCKSSKGEKEIERILDSALFKYERQFRFHDCRNIKPLPFDYYLPDLNLCIEYQGEQHYKPISAFGGDIEFKVRLANDSIKSNFCYNNNIGLLIIPYWEYKNIKEILSETLSL